MKERKTEERKTEERKTEERKTEERKTEERKTEERKTEESKREREREWLKMIQTQMNQDRILSFSPGLFLFIFDTIQIYSEKSVGNLTRD